MIASAIPYILQGASLLGGLIGKKKRVIDPEYIRSHFGAGAVADQAQEAANKILASSYGTQLMGSAAADAQQFQGDMAARVANAGLDASSGGESGASTFATSAAGQAQGSLERGVKTDIYGRALPLAQQSVDAQRDAYMQKIAQENAEPSIWQKIGAAAGTAASMYPPAAAVPGVGAAGGAAGVTPSLAGVLQRMAAANPSMMTTDAAPGILGNVRKLKRPTYAYKVG
jgi:hypothetical protein